MGRTKIEYVTDSWNPIIGCSHAGSPGCDNCYAASLAATRLKHHPRYEGLAEIRDGVIQWTDGIRHIGTALYEPLRARKPRRYLVCSMGDLFHEAVAPVFLEEVFAVMAEASQHTFLVLTKRPVAMARFAARMMALKEETRNGALWGITWPPPNVYFGVTVETQAQMWRVYELRKIVAAGHWVSAEPCLGPLDFHFGKAVCYCRGSMSKLNGPSVEPDWEIHGRHCPECNSDRPIIELDLVVLGGETGPGARPMHPDWARKVKNDCVAAGIPFWFKQWGQWRPAECWGEAQYSTAAKHIWPRSETRDTTHFFNLHEGIMMRVGKKPAGHLLDGEEWNQLPERLRLPEEKEG